MKLTRTATIHNIHILYDTLFKKIYPILKKGRNACKGQISNVNL